MKKIIGSLLLLLVIATAFIQQSTTGVKDKQYYLGKSHKSHKDIEEDVFIQADANAIDSIVYKVNGSNYHQ